MKKLLLVSNGKMLEQTGFKMLFKNLKDIRLAYITTASKGVRNLDYLKWHKDAMDKLGINYEEINIEGKNENELRNILKGKNAVHVEGGNTFYLLRAARESGFDKVIRDLVEKGLVYIGTSAGSYIACPSIEMATWKPKQKDRFGVTDFTALNLVPFLTFAHYTPEFKDIVQEKISHLKYPIRILKDGQGILVEGDEYKFVGEGEEVIL